MQAAPSFRNLCSFVALSLCGLALLSCGLETSYYVDSPTLVGSQPSYSSEDKSSHYFCFKTADDTSTGSFNCLGTEIYYKIYNNSSVLDSRVSAIEAMSDSSKRDALVGSYGYKTLNLADAAAPSPLIGECGVYVYIRLADYNTASSQDYKAVICTAPVAMTRFESSASAIGIPRRSVNARYGFDFGRNSVNPLPASSDGDYYASSATVRGSYYVDVYAVTVGKDTSDGTMSYSDALHLGTVTISMYDNF